MLVKGLGIIDIIAGIILLFAMDFNFPFQLLLLLGVIFLIKSSLGMLKDFASWIDFLTGMIFLLNAIMSTPETISIIVGILIAQKGLFSLI